MDRPLGVCTWTYGPRPLPEIANSLGRLGFDGVELHGDLDAFRPGEVGPVLADHGLHVFSLIPANVDVAHPDGGVRVAAVDYYRRLVDFAAALGGPLVSVHGQVGRIAPETTMAEEVGLLEISVRAIAEHARANGVGLVFEVLNRYKSHLINTGREALELLDAVGAANLRVLLDAYHMNIEEARPADAIRGAGKRLGLFHVADSNREGIGRGHTDFTALAQALDEVGYAGPVIVECTPPGPNPFTPVKRGNDLEVLESFLAASRAWLAAA